MNSEGLSGIAYSFCRWFTRLAFLNFLWICTTVAGLIVFGIFPATVALFAVTRNWIIGERDESIVKVFFQVYKRDFLKANRLGFIVMGVGCVLYYNLSFLNNLASDMVVQVMYLGTLTLSLIYVIVLMYLFPVFVHYDITIWRVIKSAFIVGVSNPHYTFLMTSSSILIYILLFIVELFLFFSVSIIALLIMWCAYQIFEKIENIKLERESASS
ncbi:YesL family protein [Halalkalibacter sp. AB-rgal2]|uniref:YesL family protein n=1 Tax=Halalkalibacter sp. AB-rgal2 TaxID=3242695 RepID=UPI00359EF09A